MSGSNPVTDVAKNMRDAENEYITLADGKRGKIIAVSATLVSEVTRAVKDPPIPMIHDEEKGRDIPNEHDPVYLQGCEEARNQRGLAAMDAMLMFGLELVDGMPADETWIRKLKSLEKRGQLDLSTYDMADEIDLEFLYKRYIATDKNVMDEILKRTGLTEQAVQEAEESFPGN